MKKLVTTHGLSCLVLSILFCSQATAKFQETKKDSSVEEKSAEPTPKEVFAQIAKHMKEGNIESASKLMTKSGYEELLADAFLMGIQFSQMDFDENLSAKLETLIEKYGMGDIELPDGMSGDEEMMMMPSDKEMNAIRKKMFAAVPDAKKQIEAYKSIKKELQSVVIGGDFFSGEVVETSIEGDCATLAVEQDFDHMEMESGEEMANMEMPPLYLKFTKPKGVWLWSGVDEEKMKEAFKDFDGMEMGGMPEPLPLIKDIKLTGETVTGEKVDLAKYRGKVVLVDFWGTWCPPCVDEFPKLKRLHAALKDKGFEIIGVASDEKDSLEKFFEKTELPWSNIVDGKGAIADEFGVAAFPTTLLIDQEGKHVKSDLHVRKLIKEIAKLLALSDEETAKLVKAVGEKPKPRDKSKS